MKRNKWLALLSLSTVMLLVACNKSPMGPSDGPPDSTGLEPLPTIQHRLVDSGGAELDIWVRLLEIIPARRSVITLSGTCPPGCFQFQVEIGHLFPEGRQAYGTFSIGMSDVKEDISGTMLVSFAKIGQINSNGQTSWLLTSTALVPVDILHVWLMREVPKYLVVKGVSEICPPSGLCFESGKQIRHGTWAFETEYRR